MTLDVDVVDIEKEITEGNMRVVNEENISSRLYQFMISRILEKQGALVTPEGLITQVIETKTAAIPSEGVYQGYPTMDFLRGLNQKYFGNVVPIPTVYGVDNPISLERIHGQVYLRTHITYGEFCKQLRELNK